MKTHIAQEVNIAQLEEVTQLTVNKILEAMATMMTCCSARRTNRPQRERVRSNFVAGPPSKRQRLSLKLHKKKVLLAESSNRFAVPVDEQSCEKASGSHYCRHC